MFQRCLVALVGVPIVLVVLYVLPPIFIPVMVAVLSVIGVLEALSAIGVLGFPRILLYSMILAGLIPFWTYYGQDPFAARCGILIYLLLLFADALPSHYRVKLDTLAGALFFTLLISYFLSSIVALGRNPLRDCYILIPILIPFLSDALAMFGGMLFGKHKLAPDLSPKKTVEGAIVGLIGSILSVLLYGFVAHLIWQVTVSYGALAVYGLLGSLISQLGDLSFSYVKRQHDVKDFGNILPGHGGVLDRFDSVIFCAPLIAILSELLPAFTI